MFSTTLQRIKTARAKRLAFITALVMSVLFSQWVGVVHRVLHGGVALPVSMSMSTGVQSLDLAPIQHLIAQWTEAAHSCAAFDAAALADVLHYAPCIIPTVPNTHQLALWIAFASWSAPFHIHFLSRAPPVV